jgi:hypothetical protein
MISRYLIIGLAVLFLLNLLWVGIALGQPRARRSLGNIAVSIACLIGLSWVTLRVIRG